MKRNMNAFYAIDPNYERLGAITEDDTSNLKTQVEITCKEINKFIFEGYCTNRNDMAKVIIKEANDGIYYSDLNMKKVKNAYKEIFNEECPKSWSEIDISIEDTKAMSLFVLAYVITFKYWFIEGTYNGKRMFNLMRDDYEKNRSAYNFNVEIFPDTNMIDCQLIRDEILKKA
jgi:hypothetical protein